MGLSINPEFDSLQADPAFEDLLRQITQRLYSA